MNIRNQVQLIGHLGNAPEVKELSAGKTVAKFSIATKDNYKDAQGNWVNNTDWHQIVAWGALAQKAQKQLEKGTEIVLQGKLSTRTWQDKEGKTQYITEVILNDYSLLGTKKEKAETPF
jgi:single-strand DNA-binding protein